MKWRRLEWWGCGVALFLQTGAVFPMLLIATRGELDGSAMAQLRALALPAYAITFVLLWRHRRQLVIAIRRNLVLTGILLMPFASILWSISPGVSLRRAVALACSMALAYLLAIRFTPSQFMRLIAAVLVPCMAASFVFGLLVPDLAISQPDGALRGVFTHKNVLGWYSTPAVLASAALAAEGRGGAGRMAAFACLGVSLMALLFSTSMTGFVSMATMILLIPVYRMLGRLAGAARLLYILVGIQLLTLLLLGVAELTVPVLEALGRDATLTGRVPLWALVDEAIARRPYFGYGYKAFWSEGNSDLWRIWGEVGWAPPHAHNGYRELLLDFGMLGFVPFLYAVARGLYQGGQLQCHDRTGGWIWLNILAAGFVVMNLSECVFMEQNDFLSIIFLTSILMFGLRSPSLERGPSAPFAPIPVVAGGRRGPVGNGI